MNEPLDVIQCDQIYTEREKKLCVCSPFELKIFSIVSYLLLGCRQRPLPSITKGKNLKSNEAFRLAVEFLLFFSLLLSLNC